jgi:hypothetical protein
MKSVRIETETNRKAHPSVAHLTSVAAPTPVCIDRNPQLKTAMQPMYPQETRNKFIKLRADGWALANISEKLGVPKSTLWVWDHQEQDRIYQLKLIAQDTMDADFNSSRECELGALYAFHERLQDALGMNLVKGARNLSIKDNWKLLGEVRAQIEKLRLKPLLTKTGEPVPPDPTLAEVEAVKAFEKTKKTHTADHPTAVPAAPVSIVQHSNGNAVAQPDAASSQGRTEAVPPAKPN